jgi:hypothetical protein
VIKIPFADYQDFKDCVSKNQDKEDPAAYCASIMRKVEGKTYQFYSRFIGLQEVETKQGKEYYVPGYLSTGELDSGNDIVTDECLDDILRQVKERNIKIDVEHELVKGSANVPAGRIVEARRDSKGVWINVLLNKAYPNFENLLHNIKERFIDAFSITYKPLNFIHKEVNGVKARLLNRIMIFNAAMTGNPMNMGCTMGDMVMKSIQDYEADIKAREFGGFESPEPGELPEKGKEILAAAYASCRKDGGDKENCSKIAWTAVHNAGYKSADELVFEAVDKELEVKTMDSTDKDKEKEEETEEERKKRLEMEKEKEKEKSTGKEYAQLKELESLKAEVKALSERLNTKNASEKTAVDVLNGLKDEILNQPEYKSIKDAQEVEERSQHKDALIKGLTDLIGILRQPEVKGYGAGMTGYEDKELEAKVQASVQSKEKKSGPLDFIH